MPKLVVTKGPTAGLEYPIRGDVLVGRDPRAQVIVAQREVSAQHARLTQIGDRYFIEDLGSRNGTLLNNHPVQRHPLNDGDEISIGRTVLRFERGPVMPPPERVTQEIGALTIDLDATRDIYQLTARHTPGTDQRLEQVLKLLCDVSRTIGALRGLKATLDEIASTLLEVFPQCGRVMILLTRDGSSLEPVVTRWRGEEDIPASSYSETVVQRVLTDRRAILTVDALSDDRFSASRSVMDLRLRSLMCAPVLHREQVLGVVELDSIRHNHMFKEDELNLLTAIVAQVAFAVANARAYDELQGVADITLASLTTALRLRSPTAAAHAERVARYALMMARKLDLKPQAVEALRCASLLHDLGLLGRPDGGGVLDAVVWASSGGMFDAHDRDARQARVDHLSRGLEILAPVRALETVSTLVRTHLEWYDGSGVKEGLKAGTIPLEARVLAVADVFDSLTAGDSPMRCAPAQALDALRAQSGRRLDPTLVQLFEQLWSARVRLEARRRMGEPQADGV